MRHMAVQKAKHAGPLVLHMSNKPQGLDACAGAVVSGSHTDAIPLAGMYDGTLGVVGAVAALKALKDAGFKPRRPIDAMMFTSEEPTRFGLGCIGRWVSPAA